jgi:CheY-like chemotaxis protein
MAGLKMEHTLLLVEDDEALRQAIALAFELEGFRVIRAAGGLEALSLLDSGPRPEVILLDLMMPGMSGLDFLQSVKEKPGAEKEIPVIVLTAADLSALKDSRLGLARFVIGKPFEVDEVLRSIGQAIRERGREAA